MSGREARLISSRIAEERSAETEVENRAIGLFIYLDYRLLNYPGFDLLSSGWLQPSGHSNLVHFTLPWTSVRGDRSSDKKSGFSPTPKFQDSSGKDIGLKPGE
jgi:hypothetical protein